MLVPCSCTYRSGLLTYALICRDCLTSARGNACSIARIGHLWAVAAHRGRGWGLGAAGRYIAIGTYSKYT